MDYGVYNEICQVCPEGTSVPSQGICAVPENIEEEEEIRSTVAIEEQEDAGPVHDTLILQASQLSELHRVDDEDEDPGMNEIPKTEMSSERARQTTVRDTVRDEQYSHRFAPTPIDGISMLSGVTTFENKLEGESLLSHHRAELTTQRDQMSLLGASTPKDEYRSLVRGQATTIDDRSQQEPEPEHEEEPKEEDRRTRSERNTLVDQDQDQEEPSQEQQEEPSQSQQIQASEPPSPSC